MSLVQVLLISNFSMRESKQDVAISSRIIISTICTTVKVNIAPIVAPTCFGNSPSVKHFKEIEVGGHKSVITL